MAWLLYALLFIVLAIVSFLVYLALLSSRILDVYEFFLQYALFRGFMRSADISLHPDYIQFQSDFEKLDEKYRSLNLVVGEIDRASGWNKIMLYKKLPKPKESREILKKLDELTLRWATMLRELVVEGKVEFDEGGEG